MILAVADQPEVDECRNDNCNEVDTIDWMAAVDYPSVHNCRERQEQEPEYKKQQRMICPFQKVREKEQENDDEARERYRQQSNQAASHGPLLLCRCGPMRAVSGIELSDVACTESSVLLVRENVSLG
jgi:hypothetical protein